MHSRPLFIASLGLGALAASQNLHADTGHAGDIRFSYQASKIEIDFGPEGRVFESDFPTAGPEERTSEAPGFDGEVNAGDAIYFNILGPLKFFVNDNFAATDASLSIGYLDASQDEKVVEVDASTISGSGMGLIAEADSDGEAHGHVDFVLSDGAAFGAYGLLVNLSTDALGIAASDPFYIVFNYGLEPGAFEGAVEEFASLVPEPASAALVAVGGLLMLRRKRTPC